MNGLCLATMPYFVVENSDENSYLQKNAQADGQDHSMRCFFSLLSLLTYKCKCYNLDKYIYLTENWSLGHERYGKSEIDLDKKPKTHKTI